MSAVVCEGLGGYTEIVIAVGDVSSIEWRGRERNSVLALVYGRFEERQLFMIRPRVSDLYDTSY